MSALHPNPAPEKGAKRAPAFRKCEGCGGTGETWHRVGAVRWAVRDVRRDADGVARCSFCRRRARGGFASL